MSDSTFRLVSASRSGLQSVDSAVPHHGPKTHGWRAFGAARNMTHAPGNPGPWQPLSCSLSDEDIARIEEAR